MRALPAVCLIAACGRGPAYRLAVTDSYEVGEDATVSLHIGGDLTDDDAELVITRPDGSTVKQHAPLDAATSRVRFGPPSPRPGMEPTFTMTGKYLVELRAGERVLATQQLEVKSARLDELLPDEEVARYKPVARYTRVKQHGSNHWKTYGAIYEDRRRIDARIEIIVEEPNNQLAIAWKPYVEGGALSVIAGENVRFRERRDSVTASWTSGGIIISMRAANLAELEMGLIGHFLARFPSKLLPD